MENNENNNFVEDIRENENNVIKNTNIIEIQIESLNFIKKEKKRSIFA